jgi:tetratricopeptide (TPR) repeat protein
MDSTRNGLARDALLLVMLAVAVHALVLRFVFPGYYDPLWPHHSDFYLPAASALSGQPILESLRQPRPVGMMFMHAVGYLGIRGSIATTLALTFVNCALTAAAIRHFLGDPWSVRFVLGFAAYTFLVFAQPGFYVFYSHDVLSQLSYALLIAAAWPLFAYRATGRIRYLAAGTVLALLAFLSKETYGVPALFLGLASAALGPAAGRVRATGAVVAAVACALSGALLAERLIGSPFTGGADYPGSAYQIVLAPGPLAAEWISYGRQALNPAACGVLALAVAAAAMAGIRTRRFALAVVLPAAGVLSWLANATLPHHHYAGYAWNGAYLLYASLVAVAPLAATALRPASALAAGALLLAAGAPAFDGAAYAGNAWVLEQEARQRNLLRAIGELAAVARAPGPVLVTGIDFPFSPFDHGLALHSYPALTGVRFDVVTYRQMVPGAPPAAIVQADPNVRFVPRERVELARYGQVWAFRSDGTLASSAVPRYPAAGDELFSRAELLMFPDLAGLFAASGAARTPGEDRYLVCGALLLSYQALDQAERCLRKSMEVSAASPYPYFYLGTVRERQGDAAGAKALFERAVALDNPGRRNPAFGEALHRVDALAVRR